MDTGAQLSIISKRRYEALGHRKLNLSDADSQLISASSNKIERYRQAEYLIAWKCVRRQLVCVVTDIRPDGMLGLDLFHLHKFDISITQCTLQMQGLKLPCFFEESLGCHRITWAENTRVLAEREVITRDHAAALSQQLSKLRTVFAKDDDLGRTNLMKYSDRHEMLLKRMERRVFA
ncbi:hypothetical protein CHS0354_021869 [Potamilus streckersoni]|uniref:Peptidase A2 domain-containing protein n=1 Tax=Potamilus streckersoni TaxID=2493646 RepID=A0AAE0TJP6_9BIVA|nr:hypothetical protein CHS0354_021869 [Potamilus streckersoni]